MSESNNGISRRAVLTGAGAAATVGAVGYASSVAYAKGRRWDHEADIVTVGGGAAGLTAAVIAAEEGNSVILLEKAPVLGGTTAKSAAVYWIPNNFALREQAVDDNKEECMRYLARYAYPEQYTAASPNLGLADEAYALLEAFYDNGTVAVDRLAEIGALKSLQWKMPGQSEGPPDYFDHAPENKVPAGRALGPANADGSQGLGTDLIEQLETALKERGQTILTDHLVQRVVMNDDGAVIGLEVDCGGNTVTVRARKAVVFGAGGYAHNPEFVRLYQRNRSLRRLCERRINWQLHRHRWRGWRAPGEHVRRLARPGHGGGMFEKPAPCRVCVFSARRLHDRGEPLRQAGGERKAQLQRSHQDSFFV